MHTSNLSLLSHFDAGPYGSRRELSTNHRPMAQSRYSPQCRHWRLSPTMGLASEMYTTGMCAEARLPQRGHGSGMPESSIGILSEKEHGERQG